MRHGIYSIMLHYSGQPAYWDQKDHRCMACLHDVQRVADLFVVDADIHSYLHRGCLGDFLTTAEGRSILDRGVPLTVIDTRALLWPLPRVGRTDKTLSAQAT
jgi:hypothetical protein